MTIPIVEGDVVHIRYFCQLGDQGSVNGFYYEASDVQGIVTLSDIAQSFHSQIGPLYPALITNAAEARGAGCRRFVPNPTTEFFSSGAALPGTGGNDPLPKQTAGVVTWKTAQPGPAGRGRTYFPFPDTSMNGPTAAPTADYLDNLQIISTALTDVFVASSGGGDTATFDRYLFGPKDGTLEEIIGAIERTRWGSQRRRGDFGAKNVAPV